MTNEIAPLKIANFCCLFQKTIYIKQTSALYKRFFFIFTIDEFYNFCETFLIYSITYA